jgi:glycosyltransferase involved in cell wall biosynthesis
MIAHRLGAPLKVKLWRWTGAGSRIDRVLVHSPNQIELLARQLRIPSDQLRVVDYGVDTAFWHPLAVDEEPLVVSAGREHRDYQTLVAAWGDRGRLFIADGSLFSPDARRRGPSAWPDTVERRFAAPVELREMYARASVVVVPVLPTEFPFGITTLLEAMAMGKAVIASESDGLKSLIRHGETGILVPPGDVAALRSAIEGLMSDRQRRQRLGKAARQAAVERYGLDVFVGALASSMEEVRERAVAQGHSR